MKKIKISKTETIKLYSFEDILAKSLKNKAFRKAYQEEAARRQLARQIRELRDTNHLTQKMVAQKAGMPQSVIARIESGDRGISVETLGKIAHAFGKEVRLV